MASDSILTSIPFWIVIGVIFVLAVAYAVCVGTRVNPFKACGRWCSSCGDCWQALWRFVTCCCPQKTEEAATETPVKKVSDDNLKSVLGKLEEWKDKLPLLPLKRDECKADRKNYLVERAERTPTVV